MISSVPALGETTSLSLATVGVYSFPLILLSCRLLPPDSNAIRKLLDRVLLNPPPERIRPAPEHISERRPISEAGSLVVPHAAEVANPVSEQTTPRTETRSPSVTTPPPPDIQMRPILLRLFPMPIPASQPTTSSGLTPSRGTHD
jgi:hypothetical protein